jgi:hypothetical protein
MAFIRRPNYWLCLAAFAAAFWVTLRVVAAPAVSPHSTRDLVELTDDQPRDPALESMIARFAGEATGSRRIAVDER